MPLVKGEVRVVQRVNDLIDIRMRDGGATARVLDTDREIE